MSRTTELLFSRVTKNEGAKEGLPGVSRLVENPQGRGSQSFIVTGGLHQIFSGGGEQLNASVARVGHEDPAAAVDRHGRGRSNSPTSTLGRRPSPPRCIPPHYPARIRLPKPEVQASGESNRTAQGILVSRSACPVRSGVLLETDHPVAVGVRVADQQSMPSLSVAMPAGSCTKRARVPVGPGQDAVGEQTLGSR